jgi:hypothetical protein
LCICGYHKWGLLFLLCDPSRASLVINNTGAKVDPDGVDQSALLYPMRSAKKTKKPAIAGFFYAFIR